MTTAHESAAKLQSAEIRSVRTMVGIIALLIAFGAVSIVFTAIPLSLVISVMGSLLLTLALVTFRAIQQNRALEHFDDQSLEEAKIYRALVKIRKV